MRSATRFLSRLGKGKRSDVAPERKAAAIAARAQSMSWTSSPPP